MRMKPKLEDDINRVLGAWNPIPVPEFLALDEYRYYASQIVLIGNNFDKLSAYLKEIASERMGLGYNDNIPEHRADIEKVARDLVHVFEANS